MTEVEQMILKSGAELKEYIIKDGRKHPLAIICPGGGYSHVAPHEGEPFALELNKRGVSAIVVDYRVAGRTYMTEGQQVIMPETAIYPAPQDDLAQAAAWAAAQAEECGLDMDRYSVWGSSAGGHLAASFGCEATGWRKYGLPKPGAIVLAYPVITLRPELTHMGTRCCLIGQDPSPELERLTCIEGNITASYPDTFVWCGDADLAVPPANSRLLADALERAGVRHKLVIYPGVGHGVGLGSGLVCRDWLERAAAFWLGDSTEP